MIHVAAQPEPASFDTEVRQKGLAWLRKRRIALDQPLPSKTTLSPIGDTVLMKCTQAITDAAPIWQFFLRGSLVVARLITLSPSPNERIWLTNGATTGSLVPE